MRFKKLLFQILIILLPSQLAFHFWPNWAFVFGIRSDYLSPTLFLTDILVILLLMLFPPKLSKKAQVVFLTVFVFALVNILKSSLWQVSFLKWLKVLEIGFFGFYIYQNQKQVKKDLPTPLLISIFWVSILAILQFLLQRTLNGPFYFLGERQFMRSTPGISLFNGFLRSYATFGHPNVLAGYLLGGSLIFLSLKEKIQKKEMIVFFLGLTAFILSFSQSAWIVGGGVLFLFFKRHFFQKFISSWLVLFLILVSLTLPFLGKSISLNEESLQKRLDLSLVSSQIFGKFPLTGIGLGNFVSYLPHVAKEETNLIILKTIWWLQPVHNIYLLILSETGLIGLGLLSLAMIWVFKRILQNKNWFLTVSLVSILFLGLFDHYWLTQQQTLLIFALVIGLSS